MNAYIKEFVLSQLKKDNIDIESKDFFKNPVYKSYKDIPIFGVEETSITMEWYIEKYLLSDKKREELYQTVYAFGVMRDFTKEEEKFCTVCKTILKFDAEHEEKNECYKGRQDIFEIERSFFRNDGKKGIVVWLKDYFDIDVMDDKYSIRDRYKLLYFIYTFQKENRIRVVNKKVTHINLN